MRVRVCVSDGGLPATGNMLCKLSFSLALSLSLSLSLSVLGTGNMRNCGKSRWEKPEVEGLNDTLYGQTYGNEVAQYWSTVAAPATMGRLLNNTLQPVISALQQELRGQEASSSGGAAASEGPSVGPTLPSSDPAPASSSGAGGLDEYNTQAAAFDYAAYTAFYQQAALGALGGTYYDASQYPGGYYPPGASAATTMHTPYFPGYPGAAVNGAAPGKAKKRRPLVKPPGVDDDDEGVCKCVWVL